MMLKAWIKNGVQGMKFVLNEYHSNVADEELLADIKRVAKE